MRTKNKINWVEKDVGFLDEGKEGYTLFSIREKNGVFRLYLEGEGWKKTSKSVPVKGIAEGRRLADRIAMIIGKAGGRIE